MIHVQISMEFDAAPEVVFDLLADHTKHPLWDPNMLEATVSDDGPIVRGTTGTTVGRFRGRRVESEVYYDAYDRPTYVSGGASSGPVNATQSCEFIPTDVGTRIDWRMDAEFNGAMRLMQPFLRSSLERQRRDTLAALKDYIESGAHDGA